MTGLRVTILVLLITIVNLTSAVEYYSDVFDNVDINAILSNKRLANQYMACMLDKGPCTADGRSLRRILPDALATTCEKCNPRQQVIAKKIFNYLKYQDQEAYVMFLDKYDPEGIFLGPFEEYFETVPDEFK